jgi:DNA helicase II / ATP-dependent DNA helicase PcrA
MSHLKLTSEQLAVVHHPSGRHARVLAVAGSGKTTTMAERVKYLIDEQDVHPQQILVLMFNRLARLQFQDRLTQVDLAPEQQPSVHTFHSLAYRFIGQMTRRGTVPNATQFWFDDERIYYHVNVAITRLERAQTIPTGVIDPEEAVTAISLWKGSLIPPERAGYRGDMLMAQVYAEYEQLRLRQTALTFDDFIPLVVGILENESPVARQWCGRVRHLIVDEYQDINYGQQRFLELLAGDRADVMVVGDDDQTIYEWRGARPTYILREFQSVFAGKPHTDYTLSRSFRFGPVLAQAAFNSVSHNTTRVEKALIAHNAAQAAELHVITDGAETDSNAEIAEQIIRLVKEDKVSPTEIRVLVRTFSQLARLEATFLRRAVPYRVEGRQPFFERKENRTLLNYVRLAQALDDPTMQTTEDWLLSIANMPSRKLPRQTLAQALRSARLHQATPRQALELMVDDPRSPLYPSQQERIVDLIAVLDTLKQRSGEASGLTAGQLLIWLVETTKYLDHFTAYYGDGWEAFDRQRAVQNFLDYAQGTGLSPTDFIQHIAKLDTTRGVPEDQQIVLTTVFREKGCEYDYVFIPDCIEGYLPCLRESGSLIFDTAGLVAEPEPSEAIENERRLFYVALTRARKAVYIGTAAAPRSSGEPLPSRFLDELRLKPTVKVMGALQKLAAGESDAVALLRAVKRNGGVRKVIRLLTSEYLKDVGDKALSGKVARIAAARPEAAFAYRFALTPPTISTAQPPQVTPALHRAWDAVAL